MLCLVLIVNFFLIVRVYYKIFNRIHLEASKYIFCLVNLDLLFLRTIFAPSFNYLHCIRHFSEIIPHNAIFSSLTNKLTFLTEICKRKI